MENNILCVFVIALVLTSVYTLCESVPSAYTYLMNSDKCWNELYFQRKRKKHIIVIIKGNVTMNKKNAEKCISFEE